MIEVRQPVISELAHIVRLRHKVLDAPRGIPLLECVDAEDLDEATLHVAAFDNRKPVSTLRVEQHPDYGTYVRRMATAVEYRRQGIGRLVLQSAELLAQDHGYGMLTLHSRPGSEVFYTSCGYTATGEFNEDAYGVYPKMIKVFHE